MMAFFNGKKKSKFVMVAVLVITLMVTCAMPAVVFADEHTKPEWGDYENDPQTAIDPAMQNSADEAQQKAKEAEDAAKAAKEQAEKAAAEVTNAENAAGEAKDKADDAADNAGKAEQTHKDGAAYTDGEKTKIETAVNNAVDVIEDKVDEAKKKAKEAEDAAKAAADAEAAAKLAATQAEAEKAAKDAADAAALAQTKANEANAAYVSAQDTLDKAKKAYDDAVAAAKVVLDGYNSNMQTYIDTVNNFDLAQLRKAYDEAAAKAKAAEQAAADASVDADNASQAAALAAEKAMNYYVDPAKLALDNAQKAKAEAEKAKAEADKVLAEKQGIEAQKQSEYNAIQPTLEAKARADQQKIVDQKEEEYKKLKEKHDSLHWFWDAIERAILENKMEDVSDDINKAKSDSTYKGLFASAQAANPQYQALVAAQTDSANAKTQVESQAAVVAIALTNCAEKEALLHSAEKTRDDYLADIKAAIGDDAKVAQILADLHQSVDDSETDVNRTVYDADRYGWACGVEDDVFWALFHLDVAGDAINTKGEINVTYTKQTFTDWLNKNFPWIHYVKDTDDIIAAAEKAYREELKLHEEELAMNQAYLAKVEAAKAAELAALKKQEAAEAAAKLVNAQQELAQAEQILADAKARVAKLQQLKLDTENALKELNRAQTLVDEAKKAKDDAQKSADAAKQSSDNASKELDRFTVGSYRVEYLVSGSAVQVADSVQGNTTASSINITTPNLYANYKNYHAAGIDRAKLESDGSVTIAYSDPGLHEHSVTVWFEINPVTPQPSNPGINNKKSGGSSTYTVADEAVPASPISGQAVTVSGTGIDTPAEVTILDEKAPAGPLPKTGGVAPMFLYGIGLLMAGGGIALRRKDKEK